jgi:DNA-binding CsgD family transcriptional regulator/N-acetylneuraminic acid mutarotase
MGEDKAELTERELEIVRAVATGATNQQIAQELMISVNTVKVHLKNIFVKLGIQSRTEVALHAVREGLIEVERPVVPYEVVDEAEPLGREPISRWKRLALVLAAALAALLVWLPRVEQVPASTSASEFVDVPGAAGVTGPELQVQRWETMAPLPTARSRLAAVYDGGLIYTIGGDTPEGVTGVVEVYDLSTNSWRSGADKPTAVHNAGAGVLGGKVYVPGGYSAEGGVIADLEIYDPQEDSWAQGASMPLGLCAYALAVVENRLYVFGGWDGAKYVASTYEYDPSSDAWSEKTPMPSARGFAAAGAVQGQIHIVGGYDGQQELDRVQRYDPSAEGGGSPWVELSPMNVPRGGLGVATIAGSLYAIGGGWDGYLAFNERYDPRSDAWSTIETPLVGEWRNLAVVASETRVYALGGWSREFLDTNYEYMALFTYYLPQVR